MYYRAYAYVLQRYGSFFNRNKKKDNMSKKISLKPTLPLPCLSFPF